MTRASPLDSTLAKAIRRSYLLRLGQCWRGFQAKNDRAHARNVHVGGRIENLKQLHRHRTQLHGLLGPLLPVYTVEIDAKSRSSYLVGSLFPEPLSDQLDQLADAKVAFLALLCPGTGKHFKDVGVTVTRHAIDRVIQRTDLVTLPLAEADILAIHTEFSDLIPVGCVASKSLQRHSSHHGADATERLNVLLPSANGVFLGNWRTESRELVVKTFVDTTRLNTAQREAVRDLRAITDSDLAVPVLDSVAPGWLNVDVSSVHKSLIDAWTHYGWRFALERLHPGLSDSAWHSHDGDTG